MSNDFNEVVAVIADFGLGRRKSKGKGRERKSRRFGKNSISMMRLRSTDEEKNCEIVNLLIIICVVIL